jgi:hypothetical protein
MYGIRLLSTFSLNPLFRLHNLGTEYTTTLLWERANGGYTGLV